MKFVKYSVSLSKKINWKVWNYQGCLYQFKRKGENDKEIARYGPPEKLLDMGYQYQNEATNLSKYLENELTWTPEGVPHADDIL